MSYPEITSSEKNKPGMYCLLKQIINVNYMPERFDKVDFGCKNYWSLKSTGDTLI
jgi:hypothetical protein